MARELLFIIQGQHGITNTSLLATMQDHASVNNLVISIVWVMYPHVLDIGHLSHTIDNAGRIFVVSVLNGFISSLITFLSCSPKAKLAWKCWRNKSDKTYNQHICGQNGSYTPSYNLLKWRLSFFGGKWRSRSSYKKEDVRYASGFSEKMHFYFWNLP